MLASLTGLLLTLGGNQPAVYIDPPLDPEIFQWDEKGLVLTNTSDEVQFLQFPQDGDRPRLYFYSDVYWMGKDTARQGWQIDGSDPECTFVMDPFQLRGPNGEEQLFSQPKYFYGGQYFEITLLTMCPGDAYEFSLAQDLSQIKQLVERVKNLEQALESCQCASDLDGDGAVGFNDLVQLISDWGPCIA